MIHGRFPRSGCARARSWTLLALAALAGCSTGGKKDQNYGKDVGLVYEPAEAGPVSTDARSADGGQGNDSRTAVDGGAADGGADGADAAADDAG